MKRNRKFEIHDLVRTADIKKTFSKGDSTFWSNQMWEITEYFNDALTIYQVNNLPERYSEALFKCTKLSKKENNSVMKALGLF